MGPAELRPGTIYFDVCEFGPTFAEEHQSSFDVAFLNPPYNPTCPGLVVALHADAGPDAQDKFHRQVALLPSVLTPSGHCVGNQMALVEHMGNQAIVRNIDELREVFGGQCDIRYTRMMQEGHDISVADFLREQYAPIVQRGLLSAASVDTYIRQTSGEHLFFAMIYYEVSRSTSYTAEYFEPASGRPESTWAERLWIHHCILNTASTSKTDGK